MFNKITFRNFKSLRSATLPLEPFTLIVGPNGSGKSSVLKALQLFKNPGALPYSLIASKGCRDQPVVVEAYDAGRSLTVTAELLSDGRNGRQINGPGWSGENVTPQDRSLIESRLTTISIFSFREDRIGEAAQVQPGIELAHDGGNLVAVLEELRDNHDARWNALNAELVRWLPEFSRITLKTASAGVKALCLTTKDGDHQIESKELSQGTLLGLALLTIAYLPNTPLLIGLEEPDRGLHPRILRHLHDALYRLSYPEACGETRAAVQVIATTHSPYLLDLYTDRPQEIVLAQKVGLDSTFVRLADQPNLKEIIGDAPLGEVWFTGILGGVP